MEFPGRDDLADVLDAVPFPRFATLRYDPPTPTLDGAKSVARKQVETLPLSSLPPNATVAVGLGSRGITDVVPVARAVVDTLRDHGHDPTVVPAMGSHGGASAEGQTRTLAALGLTEAVLGCPIDARMDAECVGTADIGTDVYVASAALEADATLVVNRVKPHTNFVGAIESGLCKMLAVGLGKQPGARAFHERALADGYEDTIRTSLPLVVEAANVVGGVAIVENFADETDRVEAVPASALLDREPALLERARENLPTLPYDDLDVLVVDRIGKDISGTGMDTNVIGRYAVLNAEEPETPAFARILVRGLTPETHGNGHGIGLADFATADAVGALDLDQMYTNALTSASVERSRLPLVLPDDEFALTAAVSTVGPYDPETVRIAWIRDTAHLSSFRVSSALAAESHEHVTVEGWANLRFEEGTAQFDPVEDHPGR